MPYIKNRTTVDRRVCRNVVCADLRELRIKEVPFENKKVKEMNGRGL